MSKRGKSCIFYPFDGVDVIRGSGGKRRRRGGKKKENGKGWSSKRGESYIFYPSDGCNSSIKEEEE